MLSLKTAVFVANRPDFTRCTPSFACSAPHQRPTTASSRWRQPAEQHTHQRAHSRHFSYSPFSFPSLLSLIHPSLQSRDATVARPGHNSLSGLIKRSRQFLATVNKSSGQRSLFTPPQSSSVMLFGPLFRSLRKKK